MDTTSLKQKIVQKLLQRFQLDRIILFGSRASGHAQEDSDFDLLVVTDDDSPLHTYEEINKMYLAVRESLDDVIKPYSLDLLVYNKTLYSQFLKKNNTFARNILKQGKVWYERKH